MFISVVTRQQVGSFVPLFVLLIEIDSAPLWGQTVRRIVPVRAIHPEEILREKLLEHGIKQKELAQMTGVQATHLNEFIKGKRNLNEDLAIKLEESLGISYKNWTNLHNRDNL